MSVIEELKRLEKEASAWPWSLDCAWRMDIESHQENRLVCEFRGFHNDKKAIDRELIIKARNSLPALLAVVDAIKPLVEEWKGQPVIDDYVYHTRQAVVDAFKQLEKL